MWMQIITHNWLFHMYNLFTELEIKYYPFLFRRIDGINV